MNECDETESCGCNACLKARADFQRWCDVFEARWAAREHKDCGPLCPVHGDVRDTSLMEVGASS